MDVYRLYVFMMASSDGHCVVWTLSDLPLLAMHWNAICRARGNSPARIDRLMASSADASLDVASPVNLCKTKDKTTTSANHMMWRRTIRAREGVQVCWVCTVDVEYSLSAYQHLSARTALSSPSSFLPHPSSFSLIPSPLLFSLTALCRRSVRAIKCQSKYHQQLPRHQRLSGQLALCLWRYALHGVLRVRHTLPLPILTCFKWESWDPDLKEMQDVKGACANGSTCTFLMNDGSQIPVSLSNVEKNKSLTFSGGMFGGLLSFKADVLISPLDASSSKVDYRLDTELHFI